MLSATTFCTLAREFSPLGVREGQVKENACTVEEGARIGRLSRMWAGSTSLEKLAVADRRVVAGRAYRASCPQVRSPIHHVTTGGARPLAIVVPGVPSQSPANAAYKRLQRSGVVWLSLFVTAASTEGYELSRCQIRTYETGGHGIRFPPPPVFRPKTKSAVLARNH